MKLNKVLIWLLTFSLILALAGCGKQVATVEVAEETVAEEPVEEEVEEEPVETQAPEPTPEPKPNISIEWTTITETRTDNSGYTFEITYKIGPWILLSDDNKDIMEKAWKEIDGGKNRLPGFNDWGLTRNMNGYRRTQRDVGYFAVMPMTDMYYRMGTVQIKNTTKGWTITENNPMSFNLFMNSGVKQVIGGSSATILRIFYGNGARDVEQYIFPQLKSDKWGPVSFIFMTGESFEPDNPDGRYFKNIQESAFMGKHGGIFGKDGVYTPPLADTE